MLFETERLIIRKMTPHDFIPFNEMQQNEQVMKHITGRPRTIDENRKELNKILHHYETENDDFLVMAIVRKEDNRFVGTCAIIKNEQEAYEIGYRLLEDVWGNGFGKEVLAGLIRYSLLTSGVDCIVAYTNIANKPSVKILDQSPLKFVRECMEDNELVRYYKLQKTDGVLF